MNKRNCGRWISKRYQQGATAALLSVLLLALAAVVPSAQGQAFKVLYNFTETGGDGGHPYAGVIRDAAGNLYGTTFFGGSGHVGTVFKLKTAGKESVLYSFGVPPDGAYPFAGVIRDGAGNLYGTTAGGGIQGGCSPYLCGTIFTVDSAGKEKVLYEFTGQNGDGAFPYGGVIRDASGNLYGTAQTGGVSGYGTLYKLDTTLHETVLHSFTGKKDGKYPLSGLLRDAAGNLYGTTNQGGNLAGCNQAGCGTVFKLTPAGKLIVLHTFTDSATDGVSPYYGALIRDKAGNLYGATPYGGSQGGCGTVYTISPHKVETILHTFNCGEGAVPYAGLVRDKAGNLYGTTSQGGLSGAGVVFKLDTTGKLTPLYTFTGGADGSVPYSTLIMDKAGKLYGTTFGGGASNFGVVFEVTP